MIEASRRPSHDQDRAQLRRLFGSVDDSSAGRPRILPGQPAVPTDPGPRLDQHQVRREAFLEGHAPPTPTCLQSQARSRKAHHQENDALGSTHSEVAKMHCGCTENSRYGSSIRAFEMLIVPMTWNIEVSTFEKTKMKAEAMT